MTPLRPLLAAGMLVALSAPSWALPPARIGVRNESGCAGAQVEAVAKAKTEASRRLKNAKKLVDEAIGGDIAAKLKLSKDILLLDLGLDMNQMPGFSRVLGSMEGIVNSADYKCQRVKDENCGDRGAYVTSADSGNIVRLCPKLFEMKLSEQADTLVHESAHLVDSNITDIETVGGAQGPGYCLFFMCDSRCMQGPEINGKRRPFYVADNWAHFVHCASGAPPDKGETF